MSKSIDNAKKCIAAGGVVMDPEWLRDSAMTDPRIYTGAEALRLLGAATSGTWAAVRLLGGPAVTTSYNGYVIASVDNTGGTGAADAAILAASKDLAASVAHHAAVAEQANAANVDLNRQLMAEAVRVDKAEMEIADARQALTEWDVEPDGDLAAGIHDLGQDRERQRDEIASLENDLSYAKVREDRLARVLAVERGDQTQAPMGWSRFGDSGWKRRRDQAIIQRHSSEALDVWERRGIRRDDPRHRQWESALDAMDAIDAEGAQ